MSATKIVQGTISGTAIEGYVRSLRRTEHLCNPGQHITLILEPDWPGTADPGSAVVLYEDVTLITSASYVIKATKSRPSYDWQIEIDDNFTRLANYFIDDKLQARVIRSCSSWATEILGLCGINSVSFTSADANIPPGTEFGLRSAWESLQSIMAYASWYLRFAPDGTAILGAVSSGGEDYTFSDTIDFGLERGDETTRNVIKVFGSGQVGPVGRGRIFASARRDIAGITPDRIAAVGSPLIETQAEAGRVANYLVSELGSITEHKTVSAVGNPNVRIGQKARIVHDQDGLIYNGVDVITTAEHKLDENGYVMDLKLGERCPRIAGWSRYTGPIYAGTSGSGIFRSVDAGISWSDFNEGFPTGDKFVSRIAANPYDELMSIVNGSLYYHDSTAWVEVSLPMPQNSAGDSPAPSAGELIAVDSTYQQGEFNVLTMNAQSSGSDIQQARSWIFNTLDGGTNWTSIQLQTSGSGWHCVAYDMSSALGTPTAVVSSGSTFAGVALFGINFNQMYKRGASGFPPEHYACISKDSWTDDDLALACFPQQGLTRIEPHAVTITGTSPNRIMQVWFVAYGDWGVTTPSGQGLKMRGYGALKYRRYTVFEENGSLGFESNYHTFLECGIKTLYGTMTFFESETLVYGKIQSFRASIRTFVRGSLQNAFQWTGDVCIGGTSDQFYDCIVGYIRFPDV